MALGVAHIKYNVCHTCAVLMARMELGGVFGHARVPKREKVDLNLYSIIIFEWESMSSNLVFTRGLKIAGGILLAFL